MGSYIDNRIEGDYVCQPKAICWGSIFGGWIVATAIAMLMYVLGTAIGITAIDLSDADALNSKIAILTVLWVAATWLVALYLGSYFASSVGRNPNYYCGKKQGVAVWALSTVLTILVGVTGLGVTGVTGVMATAQASGAVAAAAPAIAKGAKDLADKRLPGSFQVGVRDTINDIIKDRASDAAGIDKSEVRINSRGYRAFATQLIYGDTEEAKNQLAMNSNLSRAEIDKISKNLEQKTEELKAKVKAAAEKVAKYTEAALWSAVLISLLSLLSAIMGGIAGKRQYIVVERRSPSSAV